MPPTLIMFGTNDRHIEFVKEKGEQERIQAYWHVYHCLNNIIVSNGKMYVIKIPKFRFENTFIMKELIMFDFKDSINTRL